MNNKEKQIEEMAKIIAQYGCCINEKGFCEWDGVECELDCRMGEKNKICAEALINAGYIKVNEGDAVFTKEEHKQMLIDFIDSQKISDKIVADRTRKETAREILQYLYDVQMFGKRGEMFRAIEQIAKQYGVEVD